MPIPASVKYALGAAAALGTAYLVATHYSKAEEAAQEAFQNLQQCFTASNAKACAIGTVSHLCSGIETGLRWSWNAITSPQAKWLAGAVVEYTPKAAYALYQGSRYTAETLVEYTPKVASALYNSAEYIVQNGPGAAVAVASAAGDVLDAAGSFIKGTVSLPLQLAGGAASLLPASLSAGLLHSIQNLKGAVNGVNSKLAGALLPAFAYGAAKASSFVSRFFGRKPEYLPQQGDQLVELGLPPEIQAILGGRRILLHFPADGQGPWGLAEAPQRLIMEQGEELLRTMLQNPGLYNGIQDIILTIPRPGQPAVLDRQFEEAAPAAPVFPMPRAQGRLALMPAEN